MKAKPMIILFAIVLVAFLVNAEYQADEDLNLLGNDVYNATNVNATNLYQDGLKVLDTGDVNGTTFNYSLYANSSTYWDDETSQADLNVNHSTTSTTASVWASVSSFVARWFYDDSNVLSFNESLLNSTIDARSDFDTRWSVDGTWVYNSSNDLSFNTTSGDSRYYTRSTANSLFIAQANESNLNVNTSNSSTFWAGVSSFLAKWFYDDGDVLSFNETELDNSISSYGDLNYLMLDQTSYQTISNGLPRLSESRNISEEHQLVDKLYVDIAVSALGVRYYMLNTSSGVEDYMDTQVTDSIPAFSNEYAGLTDGQYVAGWISPSGANFSKLIAGTYDWVTYMEKTGTRTLRTYWTLNERLSNGSEILIETSADSNLITSKGRFDTTLVLDEDYNVSSGSRIVGKIYAVVGTSGVVPDLVIYGGGSDDSRWEIPTNKELLDDIYVLQSSESDLNVNSSNSTTYWDDITSQSDITSLGTIGTGTWQGTAIVDAYLSTLNANKLFNLSALNYDVLVYWANITDAYENLSQFTDDLGDRGYTHLSNFTDDVVTGNYLALAGGTMSGDIAMDGNSVTGALDVNATNVHATDYNLVADDIPTLSTSWANSMDADRLTGLDFLNYGLLLHWVNITGRITHLSNLTDDLGNRGYTHLSNFTDDLGDRGYDSLSNFSDDLGDRGYTHLSNFTDDVVTGNYLPLAGGTMAGNVVMDGNSISGALDVNATGHGVFGTVNTGQGDYELYSMNQDVESTDAVTFATVDTGQGANELYDMDQDVQTDDAVEFLNITVNSGGVMWWNGTCMLINGTTSVLAVC